MPETGTARGTLRLRPMREADLPSVAALESQSQFTPWSEQVFRDCLREEYLCHVLTGPADELVAFVVISRVLDEAHLLNIAVAPAWQRQGIGAWLLREVMAALEGDIRYMFLEVRAGNLPARRLYEQLGFMSSGVRRDYYRSPEGREDAVLMMCELPHGGALS